MSHQGSTIKLSAYELAREANIKRNRELLAAFGLEKPLFEPKETKPKKPTTAKPKRKLTEEHPSDESKTDSDEPPAKVPRVSQNEQTDSASSVRRSARNTGKKKIDYKSETTGVSPVPISFQSGIRTTENEGPLGREAGSKRIHNPKQYGNIPGIEVGTWWESRPACSADSIHAPWVAGISAGPKGAYSVALSGGYEDDVDLGYGFTYTGAGGRDLKGTKANPKNLRTAPQSSDQTFEHKMNKALKTSAETKKPIRVIRGFKLKSKYAPSEGYRYDGLYTVEKAWIEKGNNPQGFLVCKYAFKRIPGQPPLPVRAGVDDDAMNGTKEEQEESANEENPDDPDTPEEPEAQ